MDTRISGISEEAFWPQRILTNVDVPTVSIERALDPETGAVDFSVESQLLLTRDVIESRMRATIGEEQGDWKAVDKGLRTIGLQQPRVMQLAKGLHTSESFNEIKDASLQLSDTLKRSSNYETKTSIIPTFNYGQSLQETYNRLARMDTRKLLDTLVKMGYDQDKAKYFTQYVSMHVAESPFFVDVFEQLFEDMNTFDREIINGSVLREATKDTLLELVTLKQKEWFRAFRHHTQWSEVDAQIVGGSLENTIYLRFEDMPDGVSPSASDVAVGPEHSDIDKTTGKSRHWVTFYNNREAIFARPLLTWRRAESGRSLLFPSSPFDAPHFAHMKRPATRLSSVSGAAMAAALLSGPEELDIDYGKELDGRIKRTKANPRLYARAGLWPLVAHYKQDVLLSHPYFRMIEETLDAAYTNHHVN
jgi:hypothetical protein